MNLKPEELLYVLDKLGIDLENTTNLKIIKETWLSNRNFKENSSEEPHLITLKKLLEKLNFDLEEKENKNLLMNLLLNIETYKIEEVQQSNENLQKRREQLIIETMKELKLDPKLKGYFLFKEVMNILLNDEEEYYFSYSSTRKKLHTKKICMNKVFSHLITKLDPTYYGENPNEKKLINSIKYAIRSLIRKSEQTLMSEKVQTEAILYIYNNQHLSFENSYRQYLLAFKNYIQMIEKSNNVKIYTRKK